MNEKHFKLTIQKQRYKPIQIEKQYGRVFLKKNYSSRKKHKTTYRGHKSMIYTKQKQSLY
jgi:hypothetical protein